jgi:hypothetical protein
MSADRRHVVLLVHGTFATSDDDLGKRWWQRESDFWNWLNKRLEGRAACGPTESRLFRWSGKNSEKARLEAARDLLKTRLLPYEKDGQPYHLIGHSHGGSVIWAALREAVKGGHELRCLRSWTTVGTPFMGYRLKLADLWLVISLLAAFGAFGWITYRIWADLRGVDITALWADGLFIAPATLVLLWSLLLVCLAYACVRIWLLIAAAVRMASDHHADRRAFELFSGDGSASGRRTTKQSTG